MVTFAEIFPIDDGLWSLIHKKFESEYYQIFGNIDPAQLDLRNVLKYGERIVLNTIVPDTRDVNVIGLVSVYINDWVTAVEALKAKYAITELVDVDTMESVTTTDNTYNGTSLVGNKRFDDTSIVDDNRTTDNNTTANKGTTTTKHTSTKQLSDTRKRAMEVFYDKLEHLQLRINKQLINDITLLLWK